MATVVPNAGMEQQKSVEAANAYVDDAAASVGGQINKILIESKREGDMASPLASTAVALSSKYAGMVSQIKNLNSDTTKTADNVTLQQANILDRGIAEAKAVVADGVGKANSVINAAEKQLFSRGVDESPRALAMLGNSELLQGVRDDYLKFVDSPYSASAVNAFRVYGLLPKNLDDTIANSLNNRHSPDAVAAVESAKAQKEALQHMEVSLTKMHQNLSRDAKKIVGIRAKVFA